MKKKYPHERSFGCDDKLNKRVAEELTAKRKELGLTQLEVAKRMEVANTTVSTIETATNNLTLTKLVRYAQALGVSKLELPIGDGSSIYYQT